MADVGATLASWSSTDSSNSPAGTTVIGGGLDDNLRAIQGGVVRGLSHKGNDIASATTTDLGAIEGLMHDITGTTTITGFGTVRAGILKVLKFEGVLTLTHNATWFIFPGAAKLTTQTAKVAIAISEGSGNWRVLSYMPVGYTPKRPVEATEITVSGTTADFTIPSWATAVVVQFDGFSTNGTSGILVQLGDSGGIESSGYVSRASSTNGTGSSSTAGFLVADAVAAADVVYGQVMLTRQDAANFTWVASGSLLPSGSTDVLKVSAGKKATSAATTTVRVTTVSGDTLDAGGVNVLYW